MENAMLKKKINEFLATEKSGDGKGAGKVFKENLAKFISGIVFDEVKAIQDSIPMKETIPEADASVMKEFKHDIGEEVYYVMFKQVRSQVPGRLQVQFGWQFAALRGKTEEIQIRNDHGVLYKVNGDMILQDLVFKTEEEALAKCRQLNAGTESFAVTKAELPNIEKCCVCGADVDLNGEWFETHHAYPLEPDAPVLCRECWEKEQEANKLPPDGNTPKEGGEVNGGEEDGDEGNGGSDGNGKEAEGEVKEGGDPADIGSAQVGSDSAGESDGAREGAV